MLKKWLLTTILVSAVTLSTQAFQVVITELLPDPEPAINLPPEEFIELTNVSGKTIDISGWMLSNGRTNSKIPDSVKLAADSILIICASHAIDQFKAYGSTLGLTRFPALSNLADTIILYDKTGAVVHAVAYSTRLYNAGKEVPGRSLEMIDLMKYCSLQNNWASSSSINGGTPGKPNSSATGPPEDHHFTLLHGYCPSDSSIILVFDNRIDEQSIRNPKAIQTEPVLQFSLVKVVGVMQNQLACTLTQPLKQGQSVEIRADGVSNCLKELPGGTQRVKIGLPDTGNIKLIINEILFDPPPEGSDYLELYNASDKVFDLNNLSLANRNTNGEIAGIKNAATETRFFYPGEWLVFTQNSEWVSRQFLVKDPAKIIELESLPSWPNDEGTIVLLHKNGTIIDELKYSADWHFPLLRNKEGVALERKDPFANTQEQTNWFSAANSAGYGTPGYLNSQFIGNAAPARQVWIEPTLFTPNGDGMEDASNLNYQFDQVGFLLTAKIYNRAGMLVRTLVNNGLCGLKGSYAWDGLDDKKKQLPANVYIVVTDIFSIDGRARKFRSAITVGY